MGYMQICTSLFKNVPAMLTTYDQRISIGKKTSIHTLIISKMQKFPVNFTCVYLLLLQNFQVLEGEYNKQKRVNIKKVLLEVWTILFMIT